MNIAKQSHYISIKMAKVWNPESSEEEDVEPQTVYSVMMGMRDYTVTCEDSLKRKFLQN